MLRLEKSTPEAYPEIIDHLSELDSQGSRIGGTREELGVVVQSDDPRERMLYRPNYNLAFALQERAAFWLGQNPGHVERYNSNMERYVQDDGKMRGSAYGRYLRHLPHDQIERAIRMLDESPETRRAVMNIHNANFEDYDCNDVACTIYLQPMIRDDELHMFANLRSQDMLWGYPYDTQAFQWIQEMMAARLDVDLGSFTYYINSCHYYLDFEDVVLESREEYDVDRSEHSIPDRPEACMDELQRILYDARAGAVVDPSSLPQPFQDWANVITAYEQHRFHDDDVQAEKVSDRIERPAWRSWMKYKL